MTVNLESPRPLTGGQAVHSSNHSKAVVDWLQVTFKGKKMFDEIKQILGLEKVEFHHYPKAYYGYSTMYGVNNINIMFNDDMTEFHVQMTGTGCRSFEQISSISWIELLTFVHYSENANVTRLDLAIDSFDKPFTIPTIKGKMERGELVTKFRDGETRSKYKFSSERLGDSEKVGDGAIFGSPSSRLLVRMYDKKLERENAGLEVTVDSWLRVELQFRKEYSNQALEELVNNGFMVGVTAKGFLMEYIRFVNRGKDTNKRRWKVSLFWAKYLMKIEPIKLALDAPDHTIAKSIKWLDHSIAPTIAMVYQAKGEAFFNRFVEGLKEEGTERMKDKHLAMINDYKQSGGISRLKNRLFIKHKIMKKMATIRKNRNQKQRLKYRDSLMKNYSTTNKISPEFDNTSVLEKPKPRFTFLEEPEQGE